MKQKPHRLLAMGFSERRTYMRKLYPLGKRKAFNITYDDGVMQDGRFVTLLNRYGLKGTFNLNSHLMAEKFTWVHPNGMNVTRMSREEIGNLYDGHEIASHTLTHPYMSSLSREELLYQMGQDRENLENLFDREVKGFAVPFSYYSGLIADCARECGFEYARMSEFAESYDPCTDWYYWKTGFYHIKPGLTDFVAGFLNTDRELAVCQIVGHSYDLDAENLWGTLELICAAVSAQADVWRCTNLELVRYLKAMEKLDMTDDGIRNGSDRELWIEKDGKVLCLRPGESA